MLKHISFLLAMILLECLHRTAAKPGVAGREGKKPVSFQCLGMSFSKCVIEIAYSPKQILIILFLQTSLVW